MDNDQALAGIAKIIGILGDLESRIREGVVENLKSRNETVFARCNFFGEVLDQPGERDRRRKAVEQIRGVFDGLGIEAKSRAVRYLEALAMSVEAPVRQSDASRHCVINEPIRW